MVGSRNERNRLQRSLPRLAASSAVRKMHTGYTRELSRESEVAVSPNIYLQMARDTTELLFYGTEFNEDYAYRIC